MRFFIHIPLALLNMFSSCLLCFCSPYINCCNNPHTNNVINSDIKLRNLQPKIVTKSYNSLFSIFMPWHKWVKGNAIVPTCSNTYFNPEIIMKIENPMSSGTLFHLGFFVYFSFIIGVNSKPDDLLVTYAMPINDGSMADMRVVVDLKAFDLCKQPECQTVCGVKDKTLGYCDGKNKKLCMCSPEHFYTSELEGTVISVDRNVEDHRNCSVACNKRFSYARVWTKTDNSQHCTCLMNQITKTGITLCDENAMFDLCKVVCQTDTAVCTFNGVCLCRKNWDSYFQMTVPLARRETPEDENECSSRCSAYHHDYIARIFDYKIKEKGEGKTYKFREKYCLCGEWIDIGAHPESTAMLKQGFQLCTGLKCKRRCGMDEAVCEPKLRRACLCQRENIIIGDHLWARLPAPSETRCYEACTANGYDARVIEWNPLIQPRDMYFQPYYRKTAFQYLYDGKFCHCIKTMYDMHQYRPCTDEFCKAICGHYQAECDRRTRRACFCHTHQLSHGIGRKPDPGEINCDIACRYGLFDAVLLDVKWERPPPPWGVQVSKYCSCMQTLTPAGLTHCDPVNDECPTLCGVPEAYCTREKFCYCGIVQNLTNNNQGIRIGNGKEQDECGERCRSWMWPLTEDSDSQPFIYDEAFAACSDSPETCPKIDTSPWKPERAGTYSAHLDTLESKKDNAHRRFCLCAKTDSTLHKPGTRFLMYSEPKRGPKRTPCFLNYTCAIVGSTLHVTG